MAVPEIETITGYREHTVTAHGIEFHYLEWGEPSAPPLVMLHGLTGNAHNWDQTAGHLAGRYRLLVPDQRGHGDSGHAATYRTRDFVDDLDALVQAWRLDRFILLGLSMGGHNAMAYAASHDERLEQLIVIDIPPDFDMSRGPNWPAMQRVAQQGHTPFGSFDEAFAYFRAGNATAPEANLRYRAASSLRALDDGRLILKYDPKVPVMWDIENLWPKLPWIAAPTLLIRAELSTVLPRDVAEKMAHAIPDCALVEVPGSGHSIHTDRPEALGPLARDRLSKRAAGG